MVDYQIIIVFLITALALYLFIKEKLPVAGTALLVMVILIVTRILTPEEGVSGFSNPATLTVLCMFIISAGIQRTGIIQRMGEKIFEFTKKSLTKQYLSISLIIGPLSGFINNTASVAIMMPMIIKLAEKTKSYASKLLIPLSFISMAGGTLTLLGSTTNILVADIFLRLGGTSIGIFDFFKLGLIIFGTTAVYFLLVGRFLLPKRESNNNHNDPHKDLKYHTEVSVKLNSPLLFQKIRKNHLKEKFNIEILQIKRKNKIIKRNIKNQTIEHDDILMINATRESLLSARELGIVEIHPHNTYPEKSKTKYNLVQLLVSSESALLQRTISSIDFRKKYRAIVIGLKRKNEILKKSIEKIRLQFGDILLIRGTEKSIQQLKKSKDFILLGDVPEPYKRDKIWHALVILVLVVLLAALNIFPLFVSALIGVILMVALKIITFQDGFDAVHWEVILLLAGIIPLGIALENTGAAQLVANGIVAISTSLSPIILLAIFYLGTTLLTEIISNTASVIILIPIAVSVSQALNLNPISFVFAVMFAASTSFLTPIGYQTNTMVYAAGNYKFKDFLKVGLPLNIILLIVSVHFINKFWPVVI